MNSNHTVVVAMSGGVDSSTAAALLAESGTPVVGLTMQLWDQRRLNTPVAGALRLRSGQATGLDGRVQTPAHSTGSPRSRKPAVAGWRDSGQAGQAARLADGQAEDPHTSAGQAAGQTGQAGLDGRGELPIVHAGRCCSLDDAYDARRVAAFLGFPFYVVNFEQKFEEAVIRRFVASYLAGETPIPCTLCNTFVKFDHLLTTARQIGATRLATGHYARVRCNPASGRYELRCAVDASKDQTYFLFGLTQEQLAATLFPLGDYTKEQVRQLARQRRLPVAEKPESQEICFVPTGNYVRFLEAYLAEQGSPRGFTPRGRELASATGEIVTTDGRGLGTHTGLHQFTVGQRRGLGVAVGRPLYVVTLDRARNLVIVGEECEIYRRTAEVADVNWVSIAPPCEPLRARVKLRHKHAPAPATLYPCNTDRSSVRIVFDQPQRAITPGQAGVFYAPAASGDPELVLGGGWLR